MAVAQAPSSAAFDQLQIHIEQFLLLLSEKERFVIQRRFNLDQKMRSTLEEIGQHFHITRERVRQIEKNALQKLRRNIENTNLQFINNLVFELLASSGGLMREDLLISKILMIPSGFSVSAITLVVSLDKRFDRFLNTIQYHPYIKFKTLATDFVDDIVAKSLSLLRQKKDVVPVQSIQLELKRFFPRHEISAELFFSLFQIHKSFKLVAENVGLIDWRHINPRTLRDKIFYILRKEKKAMHFVDICNQIIKLQFDHKKVNLQAVHNELIRCQDFVLIGRGIYALKEWGFKNGTVAEVIESILKRKKSLDQEKIVEEVLKQRQVKPITILLNLKNNGQFVRVGRKQYTLKA